MSNTLEASTFYGIKEEDSVFATKLSVIKKSVQDYDMLSELGAGRFHMKAIYSFIERKLEWATRGHGVDEKNTETGQVPWKHVVRLSLQYLKSQGRVENDTEHGYWIIKQ